MTSRAFKMLNTEALERIQGDLTEECQRSKKKPRIFLSASAQLNSLTQPMQWVNYCRICCEIKLKEKTKQLES